MRLSVVEGGFAQVFLNWTSGSVIVGYLLALGASPTHIGLVASVPFLAQVASPFAAVLAERFGRRRLIAAILSTLGKFVWVLAAFLPRLGLPDVLEPTVLVALVLLGSVFQASTATVWTAWMGDVVPDKLRGRYFGLRTGVVGVVGTAANLAAGAFLDRVGAPLNFQTVILAAAVLGVIGVGLYFFHHDPPVQVTRSRPRDLFAAPLRDQNFRRFLQFGMYWHFVVLIGAPFVIPYFLEVLGMSFTQIAIWMALAASTGLATTILWGRVADRVGNKAVLAVGTFLAGVALPGTWILAGATGHVWIIYVSAVFDAIAWGAIGPAIFNLALVTAPRQGRVSFIAIYSLVTGIAGFLGGVVSGPLLVWFQGMGGVSAPGGWGGYYLLFAVTGIGRATAWLWLRRVDEPRAWRTRDMLKVIRPVRSRNGLPRR